MSHEGTKCREAARLIQKSLDCDLTRLERERLDLHCATCEACASAWDEYRQLSRAATEWVRRPTVLPGSPEFTSLVLAKVDTRPAPASWWPALASLAAALACAAACCLLLRLPQPAVVLLPPHPLQIASLGVWIWQSAAALPGDVGDALRSVSALRAGYQSGLIALGVAAGLALCLLAAGSRSQRRRIPL